MDRASPGGLASGRSIRVVDAIERGDSFVTLITGKNPNGEIRGQIKRA
jgi:hypothetical protein